MRYAVRALLGFGLIAFSWVLFGYAIYQLLQIGTCASGGPYQIARECPGGIERVMLMIPAGLVVMGIGAWLYLGRGVPPGSSREPNNGLIVVWTWTGLFWSLAAGCLLGIYGPDANPGPGGELGGWIVAGMGIVMGAGGFLAASLGWTAGRGSRKARPAPTGIAQTASGFSGSAGVATEGSVNPLPPVLHLVALAGGLYLGWVFMGWVSPDLPGEETDPGLTATATPQQFAGDDPNSLLRAGPLAGALDSLDDQLAAGEGIVVLHVEPGRIDVEDSDAEGAFEPAEVDPALPERIVAAIGAERRQVGGLEDVQYMDLVATAEGPRWYVQLVSTDPKLTPPWTYGTDLDGPPPLETGGAPPEPVSE